MSELISENTQAELARQKRIIDKAVARQARVAREFKNRRIRSKLRSKRILAERARHKRWLDDAEAMQTRHASEFEQRHNEDPEGTRVAVETFILDEIMPHFEIPILDRMGHANREAGPIRNELQAGQLPDLNDLGTIMRADSYREAIEGPAACQPPRRPSRGAVFAEIAVSVQERFRGIDDDFIMTCLDDLTLEGELVRTSDKISDAT